MKIQSPVFDLVHALSVAFKVFASVRFPTIDDFRQPTQVSISIDPSPPESTSDELSALNFGVMLTYTNDTRIQRQVALTLDHQMRAEVVFFDYPHWNRRERARVQGYFHHLCSLSERYTTGMEKYPMSAYYDRDQKQEAVSSFASELFTWLVDGKLPEFDNALARGGFSYNWVITPVTESLQDGQ